MATIAATLTHEVNKVTERLEKGEKIEEIMSDLHKQTQNIRFEGNGYSPEWPVEAKKRGLYVNSKFS